MSAAPDVDAVVIPAAATRGTGLGPGARAVGRRLRGGVRGRSAAAARPTAWCSWYHYFEQVTQDDIEENLRAIDDLDLDVDVVQIDDGYQAEIGDWLRALRPVRLARATSSAASAEPAAAPASGSRRSWWGSGRLLAREHPDWLVGGADPGHAAGAASSSAALDVTHPGAEAYLREVFGTFRDLGIDYFKIDFIYAGRWRAPRPTTGSAASRPTGTGCASSARPSAPTSYLLGCGAPILPSVGLVDAMRVGPDIGHHFEPARRRPLPALAARRGAEQPVAGLAARPVLGQRRRLPGRRHRTSSAGRTGRRSSSATAGCAPAATGSAELDEWGLETTRRLLRAGLTAPFVP